MDSTTKKAVELFKKMSPEGRKTIISMLRSIQPQETEKKQNERSDSRVV